MVKYCYLLCWLLLWGCDKKTVTYLTNVDYPYLNEDYDIINLDSRKFDSIRSIYNARVPDSKKDSVIVLITDKHKGSYTANGEIYGVFVSPKIISNYFMTDSLHAVKLQQKFNLKYPSDLLDYFADTTVVNNKKETEIKALQQRCYAVSKDSSVFDYRGKQLMNYSFGLRRDKKHDHSH